MKPKQLLIVLALILALGLGGVAIFTLSSFFQLKQEGAKITASPQPAEVFPVTSGVCELSFSVAGAPSPSPSPSLSPSPSPSPGVSPSPSPSPSPLPSPSPSPLPLQCLNLESSINTPQPGDTLTFTCRGNLYQSALDPTVEFRVLSKTDSEAFFEEITQLAYKVELPVPLTTADVEEEYTFTLSADIPPGDYLVECRICASENNCTNWGEAN